MTNGLISPKPAEGPPGPQPDAARGAPPPSDAFAGILDDAQQARTATAEGQSPDKPNAAGDDSAKPSSDQTDGAAPTKDAPAPDATATAAAVVLASLPVPVAAPQAAPAT